LGTVHLVFLEIKKTWGEDADVFRPERFAWVSSLRQENKVLSANLDHSIRRFLWHVLKRMGHYVYIDLGNGHCNECSSIQIEIFKKRLIS
jgi:hypothetical protein